MTFQRRTACTNAAGFPIVTVSRSRSDVPDGGPRVADCDPCMEDVGGPDSNRRHSAAVGRLAGSGSSMAIVASASHDGTLAMPASGATRSPRAAAARYSLGIEYSCGRLPDSSPYRTHPVAQMSMLNVVGWPSHCSGAMSGGVPIMVPGLLTLEAVSALAIPKSVTFTSPVPHKNRLPGLMSRWTTLRPWA